MTGFDCRSRTAGRTRTTRNQRRYWSVVGRSTAGSWRGLVLPWPAARPLRTSVSIPRLVGRFALCGQDATHSVSRRGKQGVSRTRGVWLSVLISLQEATSCGRGLILSTLQRLATTDVSKLANHHNPTIRHQRSCCFHGEAEEERQRLAPPAKKPRRSEESKEEKEKKLLTCMFRHHTCANDSVSLNRITPEVVFQGSKMWLKDALRQLIIDGLIEPRIGGRTTQRTEQTILDSDLLLLCVPGFFEAVVSMAKWKKNDTGSSPANKQRCEEESKEENERKLIKCMLEQVRGNDCLITSYAAFRDRKNSVNDALCQLSIERSAHIRGSATTDLLLLCVPGLTRRQTLSLKRKLIHVQYSNVAKETILAMAKRPTGSLTWRESDENFDGGISRDVCNQLEKQQFIKLCQENNGYDFYRGKCKLNEGEYKLNRSGIWHIPFSKELRYRRWNHG